MTGWSSNSYNGMGTNYRWAKKKCSCRFGEFTGVEFLKCVFIDLKERNWERRIETSMMKIIIWLPPAHLPLRIKPITLARALLVHGSMFNHYTTPAGQLLLSNFDVGLNAQKNCSSFSKVQDFTLRNFKSHKFIVKYWNNIYK